MRVRAMLSAAVLAAASLLACSPPANAVLTTPAIYLVPHQDDEVLTMGADISVHLAAGRRVIVVMVTNGAESAARAKICAAIKVCMTKEQFTAARNREFLAAMAAMGVARSNIFFENYPDAGLTLANATSVIAKYARAYPGASFKTMSWRDVHPDHVNLGKALAAAASVKDARFEQFKPYWTSLPVNGWFIRGNYRLVNAIKAYEVYNPAIGRYAIGPRWSVAPSFVALKADLRSKIHTR